MKVLSTEGLTKLIQLIKNSFISINDTEQATEIETETPSEVTLATVATTGSYNDLSDKPSSRNIGEVIASAIPLSDAGLHLLDGSLIQRGVYTDFVDYIAGLVSDYPDLFVSENDWQTAVATYGVCGKFVYDSTNNTVRLPKITGFIEGTTDITALGDLIEAGLPNLTSNPWANVLCHQNTSDNDEALGYEYGGTANGWGTSSGIYGHFTFDASRSNSIYGNSNTVQPQSIKVLYYIVMATSTNTDIEVDIDEVITDLNSKANDADVVHKTGDETITGYKTFDDAVYIKNTEYAYNETPSSTSWTSLGIKDKNGTLMGTCERIKLADGSDCIQLNIFGKNGSWASSALGLGINSSGVTYTYCPASDVNGSIVTTVNKSKDSNGYFKLGNGLIVQWGYVNGGTAKTGNVTFPTAFSSVNGVRVVACSNQTSVNISVGGESTTGFTWGKSSSSAYIKWIAVGY